MQEITETKYAQFVLDLMRMYQVGAYSVMHGRVKMRQYVSISVIDWLKCLIADELKFDVTYEKKLFVFASKLSLLPSVIF